MSEVYEWVVKWKYKTQAIQWDEGDVVQLTGEQAAQYNNDSPGVLERVQKKQPKKPGATRQTKKPGATRGGQQ